MIVSSPSPLGARPRSQAGQFAELLRGFYQDLLDRGVPQHLAALVHRLDSTKAPESGGGRSLALVIEADVEARALAAALLEETGLTVLECSTAEAALALLQRRAPEIAFVFADEHLGGPRNGHDLVRSAGTLWPGVYFVLTTAEEEDDLADLPPGIVTMRKPWRALELLIEAERALAPKTAKGVV